MSRFEDGKYNDIHFLRAMVFAVGGHLAQTAENWELLRGMGGGAADGAKFFGVFHFDQAVACIKQIKRSKGKPYHLEDLICFCCLAHAQA